MMMQRVLLLGSLGATVALAACAGGTKSDAGTTPDATVAATTDAGATSTGFSATALTPDAGGKVIAVVAETDDEGKNRFEPADFEAKKGDVIRYTLKSGVHNVHFLPDSNPGVQGLPAQPSDMLQLPGQTLDVKVTWAPGKHYFQCDPHALLGMMGHVTVTP